MFKMGWGLKVATRWGIGPLCPLSICHWALYNILYMSLFNHYRYYYHFFIINHYVVLFLILYIKRQIWECMLCWGGGRGDEGLIICLQIYWTLSDGIVRYLPVITGISQYFPPVREIRLVSGKYANPASLYLDLANSRSIHAVIFFLFFSPQSMHMLHGHLCMLPVATHSDLTDLPYPYPVSRDPDPWSQHGQIRDVRLN